MILILRKLDSFINNTNYIKTDMQKQCVSDTFRPLNKPTIWQTVVSLTQQTNSISLSQGAPQFGPQPFFVQNLKKTALQQFNAQIDTKGLQQLRQMVVKYHSRQYKNLKADENILITQGASLALYLIFISFLDPGDEVILFEPAFDFYRHHATICKANTQNVRLIADSTKNRVALKQLLQENKIGQSKDWIIDWQAFQSKISDKTKLIVINSPHNPTGKIFTQNEIDRICQYALKYPNIIIIEDNVYEGFMFDEFKGKFMPKIIHSKYYQQLKDRVLDIYSAGKLLEATGIRVGWIIGQKNIIEQLHGYNQAITLRISYLVQKTTARCLRSIIDEQYYYLQLEATRLQHHRKLMLEALQNCKYDIEVAIPKAGYFVLVDISKVEVKEKYLSFRVEEGQPKNNRDLAFCYQMAFEDKVVMVPCSSFFDKESKDQRFIRFAFCKSIDAITEGGKRLKQAQQ